MSKKTKAERKLERAIAKKVDEILVEEKKDTPLVTIKKGESKPAKEEDTTPYRNFANTTTLFAYGTLNVHDIQRSIWGEAKEGNEALLTDYELKLWPGSAIMYIEKKMGEKVVGKTYELTKEQLEATDAFEGGMYKRITIWTQGKKNFDVYVRNPEVALAEVSLT